MIKLMLDCLRGDLLQIEIERGDDRSADILSAVRGHPVRIFWIGLVAFGLRAGSLRTAGRMPPLLGGHAIHIIDEVWRV